MTKKLAYLSFRSEFLRPLEGVPPPHVHPERFDFLLSAAAASWPVGAGMKRRPRAALFLVLSELARILRLCGQVLPKEDKTFPKICRFLD